MAKSRNNRQKGLTAADIIILFLLAGCQFCSSSSNTEPDDTIEITELGTAEMYVASEVSGLYTESEFHIDITDFSEALQETDKINSGTSHFNSSATSGFTLIFSEICTEDSPANCSTFGSRSYVKLDQSGTVAFDSPRTILGLHISLNKKQVEELQNLVPMQGDNSVLILPQFRVIVSGLDANGQILSSIRAIPASATYAETRVDKDWTWLDTSLLGEVSGLKIEVQSPVSTTSPSILIDNLTTSIDFFEADNFFTIALMPDTQKYTEFNEYHEIFYSQTNFLSQNKESQKIVFISHLGDIVEHGDLESEWIMADDAIKALDGVIPYGIVIGNHDFQDEWNHPEDGSPFFLSYFPESRYDQYEWWLGRSPDGLSSAQLFDTPLGKFLYFHLSVDSPPPTVEWAQGVIDNHPGIPTLVTTHAYLRENGRIPVPYLSSASSGGWKGISADELFETFIATNPQIFMVTCGHISAEHYQISNNNAGGMVHELLQDYQNRENGGEGFLRFLRFYPDRNTLRVITYSTWLKTYEIDDDSYFSIDYNFDLIL